VTICVIALLVSAGFVGGIGFLPIYFCRSSDLYTQQEIWKQSGEAWITIFGTIYNMKRFVNSHPGGTKGIRDYLGNDASHLFPRLPPAFLPPICVDASKSEYLSTHTTPHCPLLSREERLIDVSCHDQLVGVSAIRDYFGPEHEARLVIPSWRLGENGMKWIRVDKTIYNVTSYIDGLRNNRTTVLDESHDNPNAFLMEKLHEFIVTTVNSDATAVWNELFPSEDIRGCMDELFYEALIDDRYDPVCAKIGILMYIFLFFVVGMLVVQVMCSLLYLFRKHRTFEDADLQAAVMIMVPCYNEGDAELRKTINSCLMTSYPEENKCMVVIADGVITGNGEVLSTPEICANILEFDIDYEEDACYHYRSLGKKRDNYASIYTGTFEKEVDEAERSLKFIVVVKRGAPEDRQDSRAGNRGKRDSQLIVTGMLNRIHHNREPQELDMALVKALFQVGLPAKDIEYLMCIDADTRVHEESMSHMVYSMEHNKKVLACCGETQVDNKAQSWVTMIQVFEYYSSHHLKKAFESVFGCVTCLPGCFTMYRIFTEDMKSLIGDDQVYIDYSRNDIPSLHEKNLFELGEDRMLTTLLLQRFPGMSLSFVPEAICWTIVPHTMQILLSQRRRWINSTFHNMYELLKVQTMCGLCCLSMKTVVVMDLIVTMILPASLVYIIYLTYLFVTEPENIDKFVLIVYAVSFCLQMLSFLMRSRYDYVWWFSMFCVLGIPVFYFILPVYAFTHMDDFSWGKTRQVGPAQPAETKDTEDHGNEGGSEHDSIMSTSESSGDNKADSSLRKSGRTGRTMTTGSNSHTMNNTFASGADNMSLPSQSLLTSTHSRGSRGSRSSRGRTRTRPSSARHHDPNAVAPRDDVQSHLMMMQEQARQMMMQQEQQQQMQQLQPRPPPQQDYDTRSFAGESYAPSLGASTIQTTRTMARTQNQKNVVAIPDGFSVGRGDDSYAEPKPTPSKRSMSKKSMTKKEYESYRAFL